MGETTQKPKPKKGPGLMLAAIIVIVILLIGGLAYVFMAGGGEKGPQVIVFYAATEVLSLDPMDAYDTMSFIPIQNMYDTLITYPGVDIGNYTGCLATSWTVSDNGLWYNFTLRQGVKFSNGNTFNASDVKFSIERVLQMDSPDTGVAWILSQDVGLDSCTIIDDYHVAIQLTRPYAGFLSTIAQPFPLAIMDEEFTMAHYSDADPYAHDFMKYNVMGTGPFKLELWQPHVQTILNRSADYWGGWDGKHPDRIIIKENTEPLTRVAALKSGDATIAEVAYSNVPDVENDNNIVVAPVMTFQMELVAMCVNTTRDSPSDDHSFMRDAGVRKALSYAFDYANTSRLYYAGYMDSVQGPIPNGMPYETQSQPTKAFTFDLNMASQLLNDSGYTLNGQGERFGGVSMDIYTDAMDTERTQAASLYKTNLNRLGISVNLQSVSGSILEDVRLTRNWDMYFTGWVIDYLDPDDYVVPIAASYDSGGDYFFTGVNIPAADDAAWAASETVVPAARIENYTIVWEQINADPNMVFVGQTRYVAFYRAELKGFEFNPVTWYNFYGYHF